MINKVAIIVPVYGDWVSLEKNIEALKKHTPTTMDVEVYFVNDCGPEAETLERNIQEAIKDQTNFHYARNKENLGFVKNCNNAVFTIVPQTHDVLLLNSDAIVTRGFLNEMLAVLYAQDDIGAVCPRSNAATIFSVPMPRAGKSYSMRRSYLIYKSIRRRLPQFYISPIAHGFSMLIRREVITKYGLFDEIYDKGYGEENDFCMRIRAKGWKCAVANKAFVFHYKARSFSEERRTALVKKNEKTLDSRYPEYRQLVRDYVSSINEPSVPFL